MTTLSYVFNIREWVKTFDIQKETHISFNAYFLKSYFVALKLVFNLLVQIPDTISCVIVIDVIGQIYYPQKNCCHNCFEHDVSCHLCCE